LINTPSKHIGYKTTEVATCNSGIMIPRHSSH